MWSVGHATRDKQTDLWITRLFASKCQKPRRHAGRIGQITLTFTLELDDAAPAEAIVDYRVHYAGANRTRRPRVFKLTRRTLEPGKPEAVGRRHVFKPVSTRRVYPGRHTVDVWVNGKVLGSAEVDVRAAT